MGVSRVCSISLDLDNILRSNWLLQVCPSSEWLPRTCAKMKSMLSEMIFPSSWLPFISSRKASGHSLLKQDLAQWPRIIWTRPGSLHLEVIAVLFGSILKYFGADCIIVWILHIIFCVIKASGLEKCEGTRLSNLYMVHNIFANKRTTLWDISVNNFLIGYMQRVALFTGRNL